MADNTIPEEPDVFILTHESIFRASDVCMDYFPVSRETKESSFFYREVDKFEQSVELFNFSSKTIHIALRDGSVITLRPTPPSKMSGVHAYKIVGKRDWRGRAKPPKPSEKMDVIPHIKEGLYVVRRKSMSYNTNGVLGSTLGGKTDKRGYPVYGDNIDAYLARFPTVHQPEEASGNIYPDGSVTPAKITRQIVRGPVEFRGDEEVVPAGTEYSNTATRYAQSFVIDYRVDIDLINKAPDGVYFFSPVDLLLSTTKSPNEMIHPESEEGRRIERKTVMRELMEERSTSISVISINNDEGEVPPPYYCNLGNIIASCHPTKNPLYMGKDYKDGVYIYIKEPNLDVKEIYIPHADVLVHDKEDVPKFFLSSADAKAYGDIGAIIKQRDKERELEFKEQLNQLEIKHKQEIAEIEKTRQTTKLEAEKEKIEVDTKYHSSSVAKKEASDSLKLYVAIGGVVVGVIGAYLGSRRS